METHQGNSSSVQPDSATIIVTAGPGDSRREMGAAGYAAVARGLTGLKHLHVRGGAKDALSRSDLADVIGEFYAASGVRYVTIETGLALSDAAERVLSLALRLDNATVRLVVALDKAANRLLASNFSRLGAYKEELQNLILCASVAVTGENSLDLKKTLDFVASLDVDAIEIPPPDDPELRGAYDEAVAHARKLAADMEARAAKERRITVGNVLGIIKGRIRKKAAASPAAPAINRTVTIDPFGNVKSFVSRPDPSEP